MASFTVAKIGEVGLFMQTADGRLVQIGVPIEQNQMLQAFVQMLSKQTPLLQMSEDYDLVLKSECKQ